MSHTMSGGSKVICQIALNLLSTGEYIGAGYSPNCLKLAIHCAPCEAKNESTTPHLQQQQLKRSWWRVGSSSSSMPDRYFDNDLADYDGPSSGLHFPSAHDFLIAGINLKNEIVQGTWSMREGKAHDLTVYTGVLGTAFLCLKSYERTGNDEDLTLCLEIVKTYTLKTSTSMKAYVTFLCGRAGNYALGAIAAKYCGDVEQKLNYLKLLKEMAKERSLVDNSGMPDEILYGRSGFLWACLFVNKHLGEETISWSLLGPIVQAVLTSGRAGARGARCPLMYEWYDTKYWGAAHGLAGIMHLLMHFPLSTDDADDVKGTLHYMVANRFPSGNYPCAEGDSKDTLVHWCHGAPGIVMTLCKAAQVFSSDAILKQAAIDAGEVVWRRGLLRRLGICHGVSGNVYTFLALHRLTGDACYLHRARAFSKFLFEHGRNLTSSGRMHGGDHPLSLFEGSAGLACLWLDMVRPEDARFPAYEL